MEDTPLTEIKDALLRATLIQVPFEGWTWRAMRLAAAELGHDTSMAERAFPGGPVEMVEYFSATADRLMEEDLAKLDLSALSVRDKVELAIRTRLDRWVGEREAIRRATSLLALPQNAGVAARATWRTVDSIWWSIGDESVDFSYYTKRASLAAVFGSTLLIWFEDKSDDFQDSWAFLRRRLGDMSRLPRLRKQVGGLVNAVPNPFGLLKRGKRRFGLDLHSRA